MTRQEIEVQILEVLKSRADAVWMADMSYGLGSISGFGLAPPAVKCDPKPQGETKIYKHRVFRTREYRDWTCAAFKLYLFCDSRPRTEKMFIRAKPEILENRYWGMKYLVFVGRVRFSNLPEAK